MDFLKKVFPLSFKCQEKDTFIKTIIIYAVAIIAVVGVGAIVGALLGAVPVIGKLIVTLVGLAGYLIDLYATAGIVFAILVFVKVLK